MRRRSRPPRSVRLRFIEVPAPDLSRYDAIAGNIGAALLMALVLPLTASIPEEVIYRGFLIGRLEAIFGQANAWMAVFIQGLIFGAIHFQWGVGGMIVTFFMGIVWGINIKEVVLITVIVNIK